MNFQRALIGFSTAHGTLSSVNKETGWNAMQQKGKKNDSQAAERRSRVMRFVVTSNEKVARTLAKRLPWLRLALFAALAAYAYADWQYDLGTARMTIQLALVAAAGCFFSDKPWIRVAIAAAIVSVEWLPGDRPPRAGMTLLHGAMLYLASTAVAGALQSKLRDRRNMLQLTTALAKSLDARDEYTAHHSENVAKYAVSIARRMKLPRAVCEAIEIGGLLHDIGKIGVPESILTKPSRLTDEEYRIIQRHPVVGYETLEHIGMFRRNGVLDMVLHHHERYDGTGYPHGLKGEEIPLGARILAAADAVDAMLSRRTYRNRLTADHAIGELLRHRGTQFDPAVVDAFVGILEREAEAPARNEALGGRVEWAGV